VSHGNRPTCSVEGCAKPARSARAEWCAMHYHRWYRHGDVNKVATGSSTYVRKYRTTQDPGHPLAPPSGRIYVHRRVLFEKIGPGAHACHWGCGRVVRWMTGRADDMLIADHVDGQGDNNDPENLVPSCLTCNTNRTVPHRVAVLRAAGWWSSHDTVARTRAGRRMQGGN